MKNYSINSIKSISPTYTADGYVGSCAIDPDIKIKGRIGGAISPANYEGVTGLDGAKWLIPNDKTDDVYYYTKDGNFGYIDNTGDINNITSVSGTGNGLEYYNNYYYIAGSTNIHRYGPIDGSPTLEEDWWTNIKQGDRIIQGQGEWETIEFGGTEKISQSLNEIVNFKKLYLGLRNTGSDTSYDVKITIQGVEKITVYPPAADEGAISEVRKQPDGNIKYTKVIPAPSTAEIVEVEFDDVVQLTEESCLVIETDSALTSNQAFDVMVSEFGDVYPNQNLATYDGSWDSVGTIVSDPNSSTHEGHDTEIHTYTISLKDEGEIDGNLNVRFKVNPNTGTTFWFFALYKNGSLMDSEDIDVTVFNEAGSAIYTNTNVNNVTSSVAPAPDVAVDVAFTVKQKIEHDDVMGIYGTAADSGGDIDARIQIYKSHIIWDAKEPYFYFTDEKRAVDMGLLIENIDTEFRPIENATYPDIGSYTIPNHSMFLHANDSIYFCDKTQEGIIHRISTGDVLNVKTKDTFRAGDLLIGDTSIARATVILVEKILEVGDDRTKLTLDNVVGTFQDGEEIQVVGGTAVGEVDGEIQQGKTNKFSEGIALRLPKNSSPISINSYGGTDIAIATIKDNGRAALFLWDTFDNSFQRKIDLPFPLISALFSHNGVLYIWGGDDNGYSLYAYQGGDTVQPVYHIDNGLMPLQGAVDAIGNRMLWGSSQTYPDARGCVWAYGSRSGIGGLHNIASTTNQVASIRMYNDLLIGAEKLYSEGGDYDSIFRTEMLSFGRSFTLGEVVIPLGADLGVNDEIKVKFLYDNESVSKEYTITQNDYENRNIVLNPELEGIQNAIIEIKITGDTFIPVLFPINIQYAVHE